MKILFLALGSWRKDNSLGNSYSSIFGKMENVEIAHVFASSQKPDYQNNITRYFQIEEKAMMRSALSFGRGEAVGKEVKLSDFKEIKTKDKKQDVAIYSKGLSFGKKHHWMLLYWARDFAWRMGRINYNALMDFINDFKPDLFFLSYGNFFSSIRLALYIKEHTDLPMVMHMQMDHYSLKRVSYNPLFWIDRFLKRRMIRKLASRTDLMYCITERLKDELQESLKVPCKVLYKIPDDSRAAEPYKELHKPIRFLYTGNIGANRWKTLAILAESLRELQFGHLDIYTANPITKKIDNALNIEGFSTIHKPVSQDEVIRLQNEADVLVHVEAFDLRNRLLVRCAISTKIMDYLSVGRSILAIGPADVDSIDFLRVGDAAMIANSKVDLMRELKRIKDNNAILFDYSNRGIKYLHENFDADTMRAQVYKDLQHVINNPKF